MRFSTQVFEPAKIINGVTLMMITDFITLWSRQVTYSAPLIRLRPWRYINIFTYFTYLQQA